jgi:hypothetical protein
LDKILSSLFHFIIIRNLKSFLCLTHIHSFQTTEKNCFILVLDIIGKMPLSIESEIDLLYHLSTMSEHVLPKGIFYLLLWKRLNQASIPPAFSFNEMIDHLRTL